MRFRDINLRRTADADRVRAAIRKIFLGELLPCSTATGLFADFSFPMNEITSLLSSRQRRPHLSIADVAEIAGWKPEVVAHWCREGLLAADVVPENKESAYAIHPRDLARFQSTYMPLSDLAAQLGTSSRALHESIQGANVRIHGAKTIGQTTRGGMVRIRDLAAIVAKRDA
jgi:hypothetical protein